MQHLALILQDIPPGTHGINKATGKLQSLSKAKLRAIREKHKEKAMKSFADSIEKGRKEKANVLLQMMTSNWTAYYNMLSSNNLCRENKSELMPKDKEPQPSAPVPIDPSSRNRTTSDPAKPAFGRPKLPALNMAAVKESDHSEYSLKTETAG